MDGKIEVFIVDDSAVVRTTLGLLLEGEKDINIAGYAANPILAEAKFERHGWPDVIILDIEMPQMDGLTFLKKIMREHPTPVVICSSVAQSGSKNAIEALSSGAIEVIAKPEVGLKSFLEESKQLLLQAVKIAFEAKKGMKRVASTPIKSIRKMEFESTQKNSADAILALKTPLSHSATHAIIAIGSSTGGVQTLEKILPHLPHNAPPILITQHMPPGFTRSLADRLNRLCEVVVKEAEDGDKLLQGRALIAPGDKHMMLKRAGNSYVVEVKDGPKVSRHKPSVDVLFRSCANEAGVNAIGFILTGMGDDGAKGLKEMKERGSKTFAQDEDSCIVYGMPKVAMEIGATENSVTLSEIVEIIRHI